MFLYLRLVLGHLIGDFLFQTDDIYRIKNQSFLGQIFHAVIVSAALALCAFAYLRYSAMWGLLILFTALHIFFDWLKIRYINRLIPLFWAFLLDQLLHLASLAPVLFFGFSRTRFILPHRFLAFYNSDAWVVIMIGFLFSTCVGTYFLFTFKKTLLPLIAEQDPPHFFNYFLFERGLITAAFCALPWYFAMLACALFPLRRLARMSPSGVDFLLTLVYAGVIGVGMRVYALRLL